MKTCEPHVRHEKRYAHRAYLHVPPKTQSRRAWLSTHSVPSTQARPTHLNMRRELFGSSRRLSGEAPGRLRRLKVLRTVTSGAELLLVHIPSEDSGEARTRRSATRGKFLRPNPERERDKQDTHACARGFGFSTGGRLKTSSGEGREHRQPSKELETLLTTSMHKIKSNHTHEIVI